MSNRQVTAASIKGSIYAGLLAIIVGIAFFALLRIATNDPPLDTVEPAPAATGVMLPSIDVRWMSEQEAREYACEEITLQGDDQRVVLVHHGEGEFGTDELLLDLALDCANVR